MPEIYIFAAFIIFVFSVCLAVRPTMTPGYIRLKLNVLRPLKAPNGQQTTLLAPLPSKESGAQSEANMGRNARKTLSFINHQSPPVQYTQGGFGFRPNGQENRQPPVRITKLKSSGVKPTSSTFTRSSPRGRNTVDGRQTRKHEYSPPQKEESSGNLHGSNRVSQNWDNRHAMKSNYDKKHFPADSSQVGDDKSLGKSSVFPFQTNRPQSAQPLTPSGRLSDFSETNQRPVVKAESGSSGRRSHLIFRSRTAPREASLGNRNPGLEKRTSVTDVSRNQLSVSNTETPGHKKIPPRLSKDSPTQFNAVTGDKQGGVPMVAAKHTQSPFVAQENKSFVFDLKRSPIPHPIKQDTGDQEQFKGYRIRVYPSQLIPASSPPGVFYPASVEGKDLGSFVPTVPLLSQNRHTTRGKTIIPADQADSSPGEPERNHSQNGISRLGGFTNSVKPPGPSPSKKTHFQQFGLEKGMDYELEFTNAHSSLSPNYSFEQEGASASVTAPAKLERTDSSSPAPIIQVASVSTPVPFTTGFRLFMHLPPKHVVDMNRNATEKRFKLYKGRFGLKGFGTQPLEGAKALPQEPDTSAKTGFKGFQLRSSQTWGQKRVRIHRRYNQAAGTEPRGSSIPPLSSNELSGDAFKPVPKTRENIRSVPEPTHGETSVVPTVQLLLRPVTNTTAQVRSKTSRTNEEENSVRSSNVVSSASLRSAGRLTTAPRPESKPSNGNANKLVTVAKQMTVLKTPTSSTVRGTRVKQAGSRQPNGYMTINATRNITIIRGPRVHAFTYTDIVGSASFSIRASSQPPVSPTDDSFPNVTTTEQEAGWTLNFVNGGNATQTPEANHENDKEDFLSVEKPTFGKDEEADNKVETSDFFFDSEGSGSGDVDLSEVSSTESQAAGKNLLELDYLRKSTGNIFFKSLIRSHLDPR